MSESNEIDFQELNRHLGYDSGDNQEESKKETGESSGKQEKRVNLSLTPEQLNEFIKAQKAKDSTVQGSANSQQQETSQQLTQNPSQEKPQESSFLEKPAPKTSKEEEKPEGKQYKRKMTEKRRQAIEKMKQNSPAYKRKLEKEKEAEAKKEQSSLQYEQPIQNQQYYPQPNPGQAPQQVPSQEFTKPPAVHPYQPYHSNFQQPVNAQVQQYPPVGGYDPNFSVQMPPAEQIPTNPPQPQINYLDNYQMGYQEPQYYEPAPQPVQDYNSLEYLRNTTQNPTYSYQQQIPQLTKLNPYANAKQGDVISNLGFKMEDSKPKGIAKPKANMSAGRPGQSMVQEPPQNQGVDPLSFFR